MTDTQLASDKVVGATLARDESAQPNNAPFFVIGPPRSGTTLLRLILDGHSRLHVPPESWFLEDLVRELPLTGPLNSEQTSRAADIVTSHHRWEDFAISSDWFREQVEGLKEPTLRQTIDVIFGEVLSRAGKSRFGDKSPHNFRIVPQLITLYPGAKFINIIRDGRDVAISTIDARWTRYYERNRFVWLEAMKWRDTLRRSVYAERILEIRYEDLVQEPEANVRTICDFLGEHFEEGMLAWQHRVESSIPAREMSVHARIKGGMDSQNIAVWKTRLSAFECFSMEACLGEALDKLGYDLRFSSPAWRPLLYTWGRTLNGLAPFLRRALPALQRQKLLPARMYF